MITRILIFRVLLAIFVISSIYIKIWGRVYSWQGVKNAYYHYKMGETNHPCLLAYDKFFSRDKTLIRVTFGYKDVRPQRYVGDRYEKAIFVHRLTQKCTEDEFACEFKRDQKNGERFYKNIPGPRGKGHEISIFVVNSSVGPDDDQNRIDPFQDWQHKRAARNFYRGLHGAEGVLYYGHSRDGGGPDFNYPKLTKYKHVDYGYYKKKRPGLKRMEVNLKKAKRQPKLMGIYSCVATGHFSKALRKHIPDTALITSSKLIYVNDALESMLGTISALLGLKCEEKFRRMVLRDHPPETTQIVNFF